MTGKVLLTGTSGEVGGRLAARLVSTERTLVGVGRRAEVLQAMTKKLGAGAFVPLAGDLTDHGFIRAISEIGPFDTLVHADIAVESNDSVRKLYAQNAIAIALLLEALKGSVRQVVYLSSMDVYGPVADRPVAETHSTRPSGYFGASQLAGEQYVRLFAADLNVPAVMLRLAAVYGAGPCRDCNMCNFLDNALAGRAIEVPGDGTELLDYIHIDDVAEGVYLAIKTRLDGVFNLGGGAPISIRELAAVSLELTQSPAHIVFAPRFEPKRVPVLDVRKIAGFTGFRPFVGLRAGMTRQLDRLRTSTDDPDPA